MKKLFYLLLLSGGIIFSACKKDLEPEAPGTEPGTGTGTVVSLSDRQKDTALLYIKDIYLWNKSIPDTFNPRNYADLPSLLEAIRKFSIEPGFNTPVDKWSFAVKQTEWDNVSSGIAQDMGMYVNFNTDGDLRVRYVEKNSPAEKAGIVRGWRITKINSNTNMTLANANFLVNAIYQSPSGNFTFTKPDGSSVDISLVGTTYQSDPFLKDSVYSIGAKKIGYMVYNSFLGDSAATSNGFKRIFNAWATAGITDAVVDLRYNGGGYVSYQAELADYLAPTAANGKVMMTNSYNTNYSSYNRTTNFAKKGSLNLQRVFFIVSSNTASASELLINNLKPYMDVKIVGPSPTYGKPVGYFNIPVGDWYIFPVSSRTVNANSQGNYFGGFPLDKQTKDGIDKNWGDTNEESLAAAIKYITTGSFRLGRPTDDYVPNAGLDNINKKITGPVYDGANIERKNW